MRLCGAQRWKVVLTQKITKCNAENYYNQGNELCVLPDNDDVHADNGGDGYGDGDDGTENGSNQRNVLFLHCVQCLFICAAFEKIGTFEHLNI